jgi:hypothetical protein
VNQRGLPGFGNTMLLSFLYNLNSIYLYRRGTKLESRAMHGHLTSYHKKGVLHHLFLVHHWPDRPSWIEFSAAGRGEAWRKEVPLRGEQDLVFRGSSSAPTVP